MKCPKCGTDNQDRADFCSLCFDLIKDRPAENIVSETPLPRIAEDNSERPVSNTKLTLSLALLLLNIIMLVGARKIPQTGDIFDMVLGTWYLFWAALVSLGLGAFIALKVMVDPRTRKSAAVFSVVAAIVIYVGSVIYFKVLK